MKLSMDPRVATAERYRVFAEVEARGMSECYESWARGVASDPATLALINRLPPAKRQPNLVFSSARLHGAAAGSYHDFAVWLAAHWDAVEQTCLTHATQTNEAGRCATLLPALAALPGPLALIEVGASAGLCLYPDRYSYRYHLSGGTEVAVDPQSGPSAVVLECAASGPVPFPATVPEVIWRAGIDLHPLDVHSEADVAWLDALIWPEHADRRQRLAAAVEVARAEPIEIVRGDLNEKIEELVGRAPADATCVVFHTVVLAYLDEAARAGFAATMARLPVRWLANEGRTIVPGVARQLHEVAAVQSDFVLSLDTVPLAFTQPHGRTLHWLDA